MTISNFDSASWTSREPTDPKFIENPVELPLDEEELLAAVVEALGPESLTLEETSD
jgi:hypothetical protein